MLYILSYDSTLYHNYHAMLHPATSSDIPTNKTDRLALLKFKESIPKDPTGVLNSWNHSIQFCNWYGVKCGWGINCVEPLHLTLETSPFLLPSTFETTAFMVKFQRKLVICFNCDISIFQITHWEEKFRPA